MSLMLGTDCLSRKPMSQIRRRCTFGYTLENTYQSPITNCDLLNRKGYKTDYDSSYEAGRGSYRLVRGAYYRMMKRGESETAANIAMSFKRSNFTYAYSTAFSALM